MTTSRRPGAAEKGGTGDGSRRASILQHAVRAFADRGFDGASTAEIARQADVTQPLIHYHFGSKEALWRAAVDHLFEGVVERFGNVSTELRGMAPQALFRVLMRRLVHQCGEQPEIARIVLREATLPGPRFDWLVDTHLRPIIVDITALIARQAPPGESPEFPPLHVLFVVMGGADLLFSAPGLYAALTGRAPFDPEVVATHADTLVGLLERGMSPSDDA